MLGTQTETTSVTGGPGREGLIRLMAETLPLAGYRGVLADLPGWDAPELVRGAKQDHRPSLSCKAPKPVYLDVLSPHGPFTLQETASRWQLFSSAAELAKGEFHVVVASWLAGKDGRQVVKRLAGLAGVRVGYIWTV